MDGDGKADLIAGGGPGGGPRVSVFSGAALMQNQETRIADFFAGDVTSRGGVNVAAFDRNNDGRMDILTGSGEGFGSRVAVYDSTAVLSSGTPAFAWQSNYFGDNGGVYVG